MSTKKTSIKKGSKDQSASVVVEMSVDSMFKHLIGVTEKLGLQRQDFPTRVTFSDQGGRVVALEKGKRQVTLHLPKTLQDVETKFKRTFDKRNFGYVRIRTKEDLDEATVLIEKIVKLETEKQKSTEKKEKEVKGDVPRE